MVIAGHDRMGRNGQRCWAGAAKLAATIGCHPKSLSAAIGDLVKWGYVGVEVSEDDGRRKGFRIIYDQVADAAGIGVRGQQTRSPSAYQSCGDRSPNDYLSKAVDRSPVDYPKGEIGSRSVPDEKPESPANARLSELSSKTNIFSKAGRYSSKERIDGEAAHARYGAQTHATLAARLGAGAAGWEALMALTDDTRLWLEQSESDGTLSEDDLMTARIEAARAAAVMLKDMPTPARVRLEVEAQAALERRGVRGRPMPKVVEVSARIGVSRCTGS